MPESGLHKQPWLPTVMTPGEVASNVPHTCQIRRVWDTPTPLEHQQDHWLVSSRVPGWWPGLSELNTHTLYVSHSISRWDTGVDAGAESGIWREYDRVSWHRSRESRLPSENGGADVRRLKKWEQILKKAEGFLGTHTKGKRQITVELCGSKEEKTGEINWKMDFLFPIFNPDNIYFITHWNFYIRGMHNKIFYIKLILITTLVFKILSLYYEIITSRTFLVLFCFSPELSGNSRYWKQVFIG